MTVDSPKADGPKVDGAGYSRAFGQEIHWLLISGSFSDKASMERKAARLGALSVAIAAEGSQPRIVLPQPVMQMVSRYIGVSCADFEPVTDDVPASMASQIERINRAISAEGELALQAALRLTAVSETPCERPWFALGVLYLTRALRTRHLEPPVWAARLEGQLLRRHCPV